jgi:hypothetical protein
MTGNGSKTTRLYDLRTASGEWLARVVITDDGYFSTVSDYGEYAYWWTHAGACFRRFLTQICTDSLLNKIAPRREYDSDATLKAAKRQILEARRGREVTAEDARCEWERLYDNSWLESSEAYAAWYRETELPDAHECYRERRNPQSVAFVEHVWPVFVAAIRAELAAEATTGSEPDVRL